MPEAVPLELTPEQQAMDRQLFASHMLSVAAASAQVFIGYTVAHWITVSASKTTGWIVSAVCLAMGLVAILLAYRVHRAVAGSDETAPENGRRLFMTKLSLSLSAFSVLVVIAASFILVILRPND